MAGRSTRSEEIHRRRFAEYEKAVSEDGASGVENNNGCEVSMSEVNKYKDIVIGKAKVPFCYQGEQKGWMLPGGVFTTSYLEADAAARLMNRAMGGPQ